MHTKLKKITLYLREKNIRDDITISGVQLPSRYKSPFFIRFDPANQNSIFPGLKITTHHKSGTAYHFLDYNGKLTAGADSYMPGSENRADLEVFLNELFKAIEKGTTQPGLPRSLVEDEVHSVASTSDKSSIWSTSFIPAEHLKEAPLNDLAYTKKALTALLKAVNTSIEKQKQMDAAEKATREKALEDGPIQPASPFPWMRVKATDAIELDPALASELLVAARTLNSGMCRFGDFSPELVAKRVQDFAEQLKHSKSGLLQAGGNLNLLASALDKVLTNATADYGAGITKAEERIAAGKVRLSPEGMQILVEEKPKQPR